MKTEEIFAAGIRCAAFYVPAEEIKASESAETVENSYIFAAELAKLGFSLSEKLMSVLRKTSSDFLHHSLLLMREIVGMNKNWTPLVKNWSVPTGELRDYHFSVFFAGIFGADGTVLPCGHLIPDNTFPLERYNGCPFCGKPFVFGEIEKTGQGSKLKILELWTENDAIDFLRDLLASKTPLDATQIDSLKTLLRNLPYPENAEIGMKETLMCVASHFIDNLEEQKAAQIFCLPNDILRFLWYEKTGFLQIIEPKTILKRVRKNSKQMTPFIAIAQFFGFLKEDKEKSEAAVKEQKKALHLHFSRKKSRFFARLLNQMKASPAQLAENMHPKRQMWVRLIRALRLPEYAKKQGFEKLKTLLDIFYKENYGVWGSKTSAAYRQKEPEILFALLKERPGLFARALFSCILRFEVELTLANFEEICDKIPSRLLFSLNNNAANYFNLSGTRSVKPLGGVNKSVPKNPQIAFYSESELADMRESIENMLLRVMKSRYARIPRKYESIFIEPVLYKMPLAVGDRSDNVQDLPVALTGTRFALEGEKLRLFMQWGMGMPAMHLDMDLSCHVIYPKARVICYYGNLSPEGCLHSGDIRQIPENIGTAEYVEVDVRKLRELGAIYAVFTCNAYTNGALAPEMTVGVMDSSQAMHISAETGVAYDPSCVVYQVRITNNLSKGLCFGVLEVEKGELLWLELPFGGQISHNLSFESVKAMIEKLDAKISVGNLLHLKAEAQGTKLVEKREEAEKIYDYAWGINTAAVTQYLL